MKISYNWLRQYLETDLSPQALSEVLTDLGLEVEGLESWQSIKGGLEGLVVGQVLSCEKHPNADKLSKTTVDVGGTILPIVCGAPNVAAGQRVVVATVGTTLWQGEESFQIKKSKIRGEASEGMICAEDEIGIGHSHDGIMVLPQDTPVGLPANQYFAVENDWVFEIGLTPNRIDAASHYGVARDVAAYLRLHGQGQLKPPTADAFVVHHTQRPIGVELRNTEACPRYSGLTITGVQVHESPVWLQNRLRAIGQRPINNVVDVTNYVLHELGQPLHAFDADAIVGNTVVVDTLPEHTEFETLDLQKRKLADTDLMICNREGGMCIAGVFGGAHSGVGPDTRAVFLESAYFNPVWVRKTAKRHMLNTDASFRFERGADPNLTLLALKRAATLICEVAGGQVASEVVDVYPQPIEPQRVVLRLSKLAELIGKQLPEDTVATILQALEIDIEQRQADQWHLRIPTYRVDVLREADVVEEVLRIYGYNRIEMPEKVNSSLSYAQPADKRNATQNKLADMLASMGFFETMSLSLTKAAYVEGLAGFDANETVHILNPLSTDLNALRQSLLFGGLEAVARNRNFQQTDLKLFEFGNIYRHGSAYANEALAGFYESKRLALWIGGQRRAENWTDKTEPSTFYTLKSYAEAIVQRLGHQLDAVQQTELSDNTLVYGLQWTLAGQEVARLGAVHPKLLAQFGIDAEVFYADLAWDSLLSIQAPKMAVKELPKFPRVRRDLALLVDKDLRFAQLRAKALEIDNRLIREVGLFDVYEGKGIPEGKRSYALSFVLQDDSKTLTDTQIDKLMGKLVAGFEKDFDARLR